MPDVPEVLDVVTARQLNYLATSIGTVCGKEEGDIRCHRRGLELSVVGKPVTRRVPLRGRRIPLLPPPR
ncbi:phosphofructokinase [Dorcoceras hygrometricum]|uniref:Phosphofructokinase n=1 Tax=Dorcoceras hygrometricum TaxID=472368 RepID=A0A2Z7B6N2_9LAMI|nr:phosphofructokinase [Dorcoceras hygrometricum]